ncbi:MAG: substrate-binding domain-containing protein [Spirochaetales bacterium]|nr:substrate-binding domain-containing protein [Spirochaetales bacterium]
MAGLEAGFSEHNTSIFVFTGVRHNNSRGFDYQTAATHQLITPAAIDGLIVASGMSSLFTEKTKIEDFMGQFTGIPMTSIGIPLEGIPSILVDNQTGIRNIVNHPVSVHGVKRFAFIHGPGNNKEAKLRFETFRKALDAHGIEFDPELLVFGDFLPGSGNTAVRELLDRRKVRFDAVIASNDNMALGAQEELRNRNIRIPGDVIVTGFDDLPQASYTSPPLTTVRQPLYKQGRTAVDTIMDLIHGREVSSEVILPTETVIRNSCGCVSPAVK